MSMHVLFLGGVLATQAGPAAPASWCDVQETVPSKADSSDYSGCLNVSQGGQPCLPWSEGEHNFCRNPDGQKLHMWCWVDETTWDYCGIPLVTCNSVACTADQCEWPACDRTGLVCEVDNRADKTPCDDGDENTLRDSCRNGVCKGINSCAVAQCGNVTKQCMRPAVCAKAGMGLSPNLLGLCVASPLRDETPCDDGNPATKVDQCVSGRCLGSVPCDVPCSARTDCEVPVCQNNQYCTYEHREEGSSCNDGNPITMKDGCWKGKCKGICGGRNDACQMGGSEHFKLKLYDGHCRSDADCEVGLQCTHRCATLATYSLSATSWPATDDLTWDQGDMCCTPADNDPCRGETCKGRCTIGHTWNSGADRSCGCLCHPSCLDDEASACCSDYQEHCTNFVPFTNCTCRGNCGSRYLAECGCSCAPDCGEDRAAPCCDDRASVCEKDCSCLGADGFCPTMNTACHCRCDEACKRCHTFDEAEQIPLGCQHCCSGVEKCEIPHDQCSCRGTCGHTAACGACSCKEDCVRYGTCCHDIQETCGFAMDLQHCTCEGQCNQTAVCGHCSCDIDCRRTNNCCDDVKRVCFPDVDIDLSRWSADEKASRRVTPYRVASGAQAESALTWQLLLVLVSIGVFVALFKQRKRRKA
ncbi:hypothetical protein DIPPA_07317 [Diplonema papillatum]|nr:hypothetical protein DIPPA_07317 [Diplonema papillatum]|eukprot:gene19410-29905_t